MAGADGGADHVPGLWLHNGFAVDGAADGGLDLVRQVLLAGDAFDQAFQAWVSGPPTSTQAIVADFMDEGHFATHIRLMRRLYKARYEALVEAAHSLPDCVALQDTASGFHTPAFISGAVDEQALVAQAAEKGVTLAPLSRYCLDPIGRSGLVFGFGSVAPEDIHRGIEAIRDLPAWRGKLV